MFKAVLTHSERKPKIVSAFIVHLVHNAENKTNVEYLVQSLNIIKPPISGQFLFRNLIVKSLVSFPLKVLFVYLKIILTL